MKTKIFYTEIAYISGLFALALGTAFMEKANFGLSMVVAPAYLIYLKLSQIWSFLTFGMMEFSFQGILLIIMLLVLRQFKKSYLFSFISVILYGIMLDGSMFLFTQINSEMVIWRIVYYTIGVILCAIGVSLMFHTYITPEVYELFVKEVSKRFNVNINKFKTYYDCVSCIIGILMSFAFFGLFHFEGVKIGTIVSALITGTLVGICSKVLEKYFYFKDAFKFKKYFE